MNENLEDLIADVQEPKEDEDLSNLKSNVIDIKSNADTRELSSDDYPYILTLRVDEFGDEKELGRFIKTCERLIRTSPEYKLWTNYIREVLGNVDCKLTHENHSQTTIDIHHHPVGLYVITKSIINKCLMEGEKFCSFDICTKVIELHYELRIGFISLLKSLHEKFHRGFLRLPMGLVLGDYKYFLDNYSEYLDEEDIETITKRLEVVDSEEEVYNWSRNNYPETAARR